jgi:hypothetical protein
MTNKQWLIWQLIDMSEDDLATRLNVEWFCDTHCPYDENIACNERCRDNIVEWLQQEHDESCQQVSEHTSDKA